MGSPHLLEDLLCYIFGISDSNSDSGSSTQFICKSNHNPAAILIESTNLPQSNVIQGTLTSFVLPALFYVVKMPLAAPLTLACYVMLIGGLIFMVFIPYEVAKTVMR